MANANIVSSESALLPLALNAICYDAPLRRARETPKRVLHNITLKIQPHRKLIILGANGAGKSVLLRIMHGLLAASTGEVITACGRAVNDVSLRRHDAMLFQHPVMLRKTALDNVRYGISATSRLSNNTSEQNAAAYSALVAVGLEALAQQPARVLSGGEQQRVAFARVLAREPELLYLDEPTANLDPQSSRQIEALVNLAYERGATIVMTTHNLSQARRIADDIAFLHDGKLIEFTPATEFFSGPRSAEARAYLTGELV